MKRKRGSAKTTPHVDSEPVQILTDGLGGVSNVPHLLSVLPVPRSQHCYNSGSLLHEPGIAENAVQLLSSSDSHQLVSQLSDALGRTDILQCIEPLNQQCTESLSAAVPDLLQSIMRHNPNVFAGISEGHRKTGTSSFAPAVRSSDASQKHSAGQPLLEISPACASPAPSPSHSTAFSSPRCIPVNTRQQSLSSTSKMSQYQPKVMLRKLSNDVISTSALKRVPSSENQQLQNAKGKPNNMPNAVRSSRDTSKLISLASDVTAVEVDCLQLLEEAANSSENNTADCLRRSVGTRPRASVTRRSSLTNPCLPELGVNSHAVSVIRSDYMKRRVSGGEADHIVSTFVSLIDEILSSADDAGLYLDSKDDDVEGGIGVDSSNFPLSYEQLTALCTEASKLKGCAIMNQVPEVKLVQLLKVLCYAVKLCSQLNSRIDLESDESDELECQQWLDSVDRLVLPSVTAALTALHIMTSEDMPKLVYHEDLIEQSAKLVSGQLTCTVYPNSATLRHAKDGIGHRAKKSKPSHAIGHSLFSLYSRLVEMVSLMSELVEMQELPDAIILQMSSVAVSPFFADGTAELQLGALKLATGLFSRYENHRQLILEDILNSLACLPLNKQNLRNYRLIGGSSVQMLTALFLQLLQSAMKIPHAEEVRKFDANSRKEAECAVIASYDAVLRAGLKFLSVFLSKCTAPKSKGEEDYRVMFENFVADLLTMLYRPEWPCVEVILNLLVSLLVKQASSSGTAGRTVDMSARVAALDYLGIITAGLRKDMCASVNQSAVDSLLLEMGNNVNCVQKALLEYLLYHSHQHPSLLDARRFYFADWLKDCVNRDMSDTSSVAASSVAGGGGSLASKPQSASKKKKARRKIINESSDEDEVDRNEQDVVEPVTPGSSSRTSQDVELTRLFVWSTVSANAPHPVSCRLDDSLAQQVSRYVTSRRTCSLNFDVCLFQIMERFAESAIQIRTKALKCLASVIEVDPTLLARPNVQHAVHSRFLDDSISVREAAIDLIGRYLTVQRDLTAQYYDMLSQRILDTGVSVRKRVIKIMRDICLAQPEFAKIPDMCVKMIRRVGDEEGIKKLVMETFQSLWFSASSYNAARDQGHLLQRVTHIVEVMELCSDFGYDWLKQLVDQLLKEDKETRDKPVQKSCQQLVDCIVNNLLASYSTSSDDGSKLIGCFTALNLLCTACPLLLKPHCRAIEPYLAVKFCNNNELVTLKHVLHILELSVPLMTHPEPAFLAKLVEDLLKVLHHNGTMIILSSVRCLAAVTSITGEMQLIRSCFESFYSPLLSFIDDSGTSTPPSSPFLKRALYTVGVLCKFFDISMDGISTAEVRDSILKIYLYFIKSTDIQVKTNAVSGLGWFAVRYYEVMESREMQELYKELLSGTADTAAAVHLRCQVLTNLQTFLIEEDTRMVAAEAEWKRVHNKEDLKEMRDAQSGLASAIIQLYLKHVLEAYFDVNPFIRQYAANVVDLVLKQGLIHPLQCIPYLIAMSSDCDAGTRYKADQLLQEINKKYPTFIQMKAIQGMKLSYRLHNLLQLQQQQRQHGQSSPVEPVRGIRKSDVSELGLNDSMYCLARANRVHRRTLLTALLNMFDDELVALAELLFVADNLAYFTYQQQDEPLFVIHQIDIIVSVSGSHILDAFKKIFHPGYVRGGKRRSNANNKDASRSDDDDDSDDEEDVSTLLASYPADDTKLKELHVFSQRYVLLLILKQHLKDLFGFTDSKLQQYAPTEAAKVYNKQVNRRAGVRFNPRQVLELASASHVAPLTDEKQRLKLVHCYIDFKQRMANIDREVETEQECPTAS